MLSAILSNNSCRAMKFGPFTFQWACLVWVLRSIASANRAFSNSTARVRVVGGRSFRVLNMGISFVEESVSFPAAPEPIGCLDRHDKRGLSFQAPMMGGDGKRAPS